MLSFLHIFNYTWNSILYLACICIVVFRKIVNSLFSIWLTPLLGWYLFIRKLLEKRHVSTTTHSYYLLFLPWEISLVMGQESNQWSFNLSRKEKLKQRITNTLVKYLVKILRSFVEICILRNKLSKKMFKFVIMMQL